jgi:hypothetical protein
MIVAWKSPTAVDPELPDVDVSIEVADVDAAHARAQAEGLEIVRVLRDEPWGIRRLLRPRPERAHDKRGQPRGRSCSLDPFDPCQPGGCALRGEPRLEQIRSDGGNAPAAAAVERCSQILLTDRMRATGLWSDVTETEHVQLPTSTRHGRQARHVVVSLIAVEGVEQPAVEHRLEHSAQTVQVQGIANHEVSMDPATRGAFPRDRHCGLSHIDSQNVQPQRCDVKRVLACPAACVENRAGECAFARQTHYRRLWPSNVPGRRALQV